ncbi:MAG: ABC transporter substrate-binding protein [Pirellulales bacterium]
MDRGTKKQQGIFSVCQCVQVTPMGLVIGLGCLLTTMLLGCGSSGKGGGGGAVSATVIYAQAEDPKTLDPINTDIAEAVHVLTNVFDTLVVSDETTTDIVPSLAEQHGKLIADGLVWTFYLRSGVKFHDGTDCDASAVKDSFERLIQKEHPLVFDPVRPYQASFQIIEKVEAKDPQTVVLTLSSPSAVLLANLAMFPASVVSPTALKKYGKRLCRASGGDGAVSVSKMGSRSAIGVVSI